MGQSPTLRCATGAWSARAPLVRCVYVPPAPLPCCTVCPPDAFNHCVCTHKWTSDSFGVADYMRPSCTCPSSRGEVQMHPLHQIIASGQTDKPAPITFRHRPKGSAGQLNDFFALRFIDVGRVSFATCVQDSVSHTFSLGTAPRTQNAPRTQGHGARRFHPHGCYQACRCPRRCRDLD